MWSLKALSHRAPPEFSWVRKLGTNQRREDVGGGGHIPLPRRDRRGEIPCPVYFLAT